MSQLSSSSKSSSPFAQATTRAVITFAVLVLLVFGWQAVKLDLKQLFNDSYLMGNLLDQLLHPNFLVREKSSEAVAVKLKSRCEGAQPQPLTSSEPNKPQLTLSRDCGNVGDPFTLEGTGFAPNLKIQINWERFGDRDLIKALQADEQGYFKYEGVLLRDWGINFNFEVLADVYTGRFVVSEATEITLSKMYETIMLALMATMFGVIIAIPLSFFGARNLMADLNGSISKLSAAIFIGAHGLGLGWYLGEVLGIFVPTPTVRLGALSLSLLALGLGVMGLAGLAVWGWHRAGAGIYTVVRLYQNIFRSIESLIVATLFVVWVGIGPAAGTLALALNTAAVLGKLCSEAIESIDPGPMEAIKATGANFLQMVVYAVIPQVIPHFVGYILYRWDGNVRFSTVLGFVGGGGVGFILIQYINLLQYRNAAVAVWAITLVVYLMDYTSTKLRARIV
jgi:phosphonate ABC transporter permease subunit PhnE